MIIKLTGATATKSLGGLNFYSITVDKKSGGAGITVTLDKTTIDKDAASSTTVTGSITVAEGYTLSSVKIMMGITDKTSAWYNSSTGAITISGITANVTITVTATSNSGSGDSGSDSGGNSGGNTTPSDKLQGTWVLNDTITEEQLNNFGGYNVKSKFGLGYAAYSGYAVSFTFNTSSGTKTSNYLIKSDNNVVFGYNDSDSNSARGFWVSGSWQDGFDKQITIISTLAEVEGGNLLLAFLNSIATNITNPGSDSGSEPTPEPDTPNTGTDELAGTWFMNETISNTNKSTFGGKNGKTGLGINEANLYQGYQLNASFGSQAITHMFCHTTVDDMLGYWAENSTGVGALYINGKWNKAEYRNVSITSKLSEVEGGATLLAWFKANGVKQS